MRAFALAILLALSAEAGEISAASVVGVLEEPQCKDGTGRFVRPLFLSKGGAWAPMDRAEAARPYIREQMSWDVAFDGRKIDTIQTTDPGFTTEYPWTYPRDRLLNVTSSKLAPSLPNKADQFSGWCRSPATRPLVVVSAGRSEDPDNWKPDAISPKDLKRLFNTFKTNAGPAEICSEASENGAPFDYRPKDLEALKGYRDKTGRRVATVQLKDVSDCDGPIEKAWDRHSFLLTETDVKYLGVGLELVDAGDYNGDGTAELLFWFSGYNQDGYVLLSSNAATRTEFTWNYH